MCKKKFKYNEIISWWIVAFILIMLPCLNAGIMHNDELIARFRIMKGLKVAISELSHELISAGRALSCIIDPFTCFVGFLGKSSICFRGIQTIIILSNILFFCKLILEVFKDKWFSFFMAIILLLYIPFSFEPTLPNGYVALYGIPLSLLYLAMILYVKFLHNNQIKYLVISMTIFFIVCCSYETFITYTPVYPLLCFYILKIKTWKQLKENFVACLVPVIVGILFLALYVLTGYFFPAQYAGVQIGDFTIASVLTIIRELFLRSLPGGVLFSNKYNFLFNYYKHWITTTDVGRIICVLIIVMIYIYNCIQCHIKEHDKTIDIGNILTVSMLLMGIAILPTIPISISSMYQNNIGEQGFLSLPVNYFSYYFTTLSLGCIVWHILKSIKLQIVFKILIVCFLISFGYFVQIRNCVFLKEMNYNYTRLENIEAIFMTESIKDYNNSTIYAPDIFNTRNTLAIHDGYWSDFANLNGLNITVVKDVSNAEYILSETDFETFSIIDRNKNKICVFSVEEIQQPEAIKILDTEYILLEDLSSEKDDNEYHVYYYTLAQNNIT